MTEPQPVAEPEESSSFGKAQWIATIVTIVVLIIVFAVVFPQFADYQQAWDAIQSMSTGWIVALIFATITLIIVYVWPFQAALLSLGYRPGFIVRQTSFMISNVIPAGGAIGLGVQYAMLNGYGFGAAPSTSAIGITGVWNTFITLSLPVVGLLALAFIGEANSGAVVVTIFGVIVIAAGVGLFAAILRSEQTARRIGVWADGVVGWAAGLIDKDAELHLDDALVDFRTSIVVVVSERWLLVTATNLFQQLMQFGILYIAILAIQGGFDGPISLAEAFAAFSFGRLATFIPIPPGGLGTTDAIITGALTAFGLPNGDALAATLIWRAATYFPQVFIGLGTFLWWRYQQRSKDPATA